MRVDRSPDYIHRSPQLRRAFRPHLLRWMRARKPDKELAHHVKHSGEDIGEPGRVTLFAKPIAERYGIKLWRAEMAVSSFHLAADREFYEGMKRVFARMDARRAS